MKRRALLVGICFVVLIGSGAAWGQEAGKEAGKETGKETGKEAAPSEAKKDYEVFDLGEVFVTSDKPPAVREMAIKNEITEEQIKATNSHTVAEALAHVPGIRVSTGRKNEPAIQIHGMPQEKVLVLIDGVPYYETNYGKLDMNQIPVDNIAKIEVIKGAPSVIYGPNALMGVVNIITKKGTEKLAAQATVEVGPNYTNRESLSHGWKIGMLNYWLNYSHYGTQGWNVSEDFNPKLGFVDYRPNPGDYSAYLEDGGYRNNSDFNQHSVWAKIGIDPNPGSEYYVNAHYITKEKGDPPNIYGGRHVWQFPEFSQVFDRITKYQDWGLDFSGQQKIFDNLILKGKFFYHNHIDDYTSYSDISYDNELSTSRYTDYIIGGYLIGDYRPVEWDAIRFAFHYKGDSHKQRDDESLTFDDYFSTTGSVALENEFNLIKNLSVVVGVSYDWFDLSRARAFNNDGTPDDTIGKPDMMDGWCPMVGATYTLFDTKLFGSIARKVRFPTLSQLYSSQSGNLDLTAETAINYTLGVSRPVTEYAWGEVAWFYHDLADFIDRPSSADPYENFAKIGLMGVEITGEFYPLKDFSLWRDLKLWASYTYNYARDKSVGRVTEKVRNVPAHKVDMGLHFTIPYIKTGLDLVGVYMGDIYSQVPTMSSPTPLPIQKVGDYFTMNVRLSKTFFKHFEAYVAINNLFDRNYESERGYPAPGINYYFGLEAKY
jgi:outer membrane cobalamin receptor